MQTYLPLIVALVGSVITAATTIFLARIRESSEVENRAAQRDHDRIERRYEDRLKAYTTFEQEIVREVRRTDQFLEKHGQMPGDMGFEDTHEIASVADALVAVQLLGSAEATKAAESVDRLLLRWVFGSGEYRPVHDAREAFRTACRADLVPDLSSSSVSKHRAP